jgi:hypothetical protein
LEKIEGDPEPRKMPAFHYEVTARVEPTADVGVTSWKALKEDAMAGV